MKQKLGFLLIFLLVIARSIEVQAQSHDFSFDHLPSVKGTLLKGWKYKAGDQSTWADPGIDDSDWEKVDGEIDITDFKKNHPQHLGWFRLTFKVTDSLRNKSFAITFNAFAATEIFLNGKLVKTNGEINSDADKVKAINGDFRPFSISLNNDSVQVLAVRYAYPKGMPYIREFWLSTTLMARIISPDDSVDTFLQLDKDETKHLIFLLTGLFLILAVLHGLFFAFYRYQKQHIYYASFTFLVAILYAGVVILYDTYDIKSRMWLTILYHFIWVFHSVFFTLAMYSIFQYSKRQVLKILLLISFLAIPLVFFKQNNIINVFVSFIPLLYNIEAFRITVLSSEKKIQGTGVIKTGLLIFMLLWLISMGMIATQDEQNIILGTMLNSIGSTAIVVMMSVIISLQVAGTNKKLLEKLKEVEELSKDKQKILENQKTDLERQVQERTTDLQKTLEDLKSTQAHLIQTVKMASLGELTAGIAHEIQNPLNFVNNFSEINSELIDEMKEEMNNGNIDEAIAIANDIKNNEEKINHHGKRADSIVKGMLQHSRSSSGVKEPTDINALTDEYLRIAFHGARAKDKYFNVKTETNYEIALEKVKIIPQDIGRVILNLINNAFYAVAEKKKQQPESFEATVRIYTKKVADKIELTVKDNGNGMSQKVVDKIFQPFFTTKPTGQGTGLGLSLSYDILKAHRGELKVETKEGEGAAFTIVLPLN